MGDKSVLRIKPGSMCCCHTVEKDMGAEKKESENGDSKKREDST